ncbi:hypothetical protein PtB15_6B586 [Puccinia triticina]|nr:hypothetical protein PtB15_6B586 [Puccinia triticina]
MSKVGVRFLAIALFAAEGLILKMDPTIEPPLSDLRDFLDNGLLATVEKP